MDAKAKIVRQFHWPLTTVMLLSVLAFACAGQREARDSLEDLLDRYDALDEKDERIELEARILPLLEGLSTYGLFELRKERNLEPLVSVDPPFGPNLLLDRVEVDSIFVVGQTTKVQYARESLYRDILNRRISAIPTTYTVEVERTIPNRPVCDIITYMELLGWQSPIQDISKSRVLYLFRETAEGIVDGRSPQRFRIIGDRVPYAIFEFGLSLDDLESLVVKKQSLLRETEPEFSQALAFWYERLRDEDLIMAVAALSVLEAHAADRVRPSEVMDALEAVYAQTLQRATSGNGVISSEELAQFRLFSYSALNLLAKTADPDTATRIFDLYVTDRSVEATSLFGPENNRDTELVRVLAQGDPKTRAQRIGDLLRGSDAVNGVRFLKEPRSYTSPINIIIQATGSFPGKDIDELMLEIVADPAEFHVETMSEFGKVLWVLANRGVLEILPILKRLAENPAATCAELLPHAPADNLDYKSEYAWDNIRTLSAHLPENDALRLLMGQYRAGDAHALYTMTQRASPDSPQMHEYLLELDAEAIAHHIERKFPHPAFVGKLRAALAHPSSVHARLRLLKALAACGDTEHAVAVASQAMASDPPEGDRRALEAYFRTQGDLATFLRGLGSEAAAPDLKSAASMRNQREYARLLEAVSPDEEPSRMKKMLRDAHHKTLMAYVACAREKSVRLLKDTYQKGDEQTRLLAAWYLACLGERTGRDTVARFAKRELDYAGPAFLDVVSSEATDKMLVQRLQLGCTNSDYWFLWDEVYPRKASRFVANYRNDILVAFRQLMEQEDDGNLYPMLLQACQMTGRPLGPYQQGVKSPQNEAVLEGWREYLDQILAHNQ